MQTNYYQKPAISQSGIKTYLTDGPHTYWRHSPFNPNAIPKEDTEALLKGKLVDVLLFTPKQFPAIYAVKDKVDGRTKDGKAYNQEFDAANQGKVIINKQEHEEAEKMIFELHHNADFLATAKGEWLAQEEFYWEEDGLAFKAKMDLIVSHNGAPVVIDYKTCINCDEQHFGKDIVKYKYHVQAAFYKKAFFMKHGVEPRFLLVAQEKEFPENIAIWEVQAADVAIGKRTIAKAVKEIKERLASGNWKPYRGGIQAMNLPTWFYTQNMEDEAREAE